MKKIVNKDKLVEPDELSALTQIGVQRALDAKNDSQITALSAAEIDQVSGGISFNTTKLADYFPYGIILRDPIVLGNDALKVVEDVAQLESVVKLGI